MSKPIWQTDSGCVKRMDDDLAAVASAETPVSFYEERWRLGAGTSVGAPLVAGILAHASMYARSLGAEVFYQDPGSLFDITTGFNWSTSLYTRSPCTPNEYFCNAEVGYDGPTGLGTPDGVPALTPVVETKPASDVTQTAAVLNATVYPQGHETTECEFEYGLSKSYGETVACTPPPGSGSGAVEVSGPLTGLAANTEYHYRIKATDVGAPSQGEDRTFKTLQWPAPTVESQAASNVTQTTATLNGTVNPNGGEVTECTFEYGSSLPSGQSVPCSPGPGSGTGAVTVTGSLSGLAADTAYQYRVRAANAGGASAGPTESFKTLPYAAPEFGRCVSVAQGSGRYSSPACTKTGGKGSYEWEYSVARTRFATNLASGRVTLKSVKGFKITCTGETGSGEYSGLKTVAHVVMTLTGCEAAGLKCSSFGAAPGEAVSGTLEGVLGLETVGGKSASDKIALALFPAGRAGALLQIVCGTSTVSVSGTVLVPVTANKALSSAALKLTAVDGKQRPESFAGEPAEVLQASINGGAEEQMGLTASLTRINEEPIEINTVL